MGWEFREDTPTGNWIKDEEIFVEWPVHQNALYHEAMRLFPTASRTDLLKICGLVVYTCPKCVAARRFRCGCERRKDVPHETG